jgi:hypothetical protein
MKTQNFILTLSVFFMSTFVVGIANASLIVMEGFTNEAEHDALLASDDTSIIATAVVRAGDNTGVELGIGTFETLTEFDNDFTWDINGDNSFALSYDETTARYSLNVSNGSDISDIISVGTTDWFNQIAFSFGSGGVEIDFTGDINGESFGTYNAMSAGQWDGILFTFPEFTDTNLESWTITGTMSMSTILPDLGGDQFRGEFYLVKNTAVVPEPSSFALLVSALALAIAFCRRRR